MKITEILFNKSKNNLMMKCSATVYFMYTTVDDTGLSANRFQEIYMMSNLKYKFLFLHI